MVVVNMSHEFQTFLQKKEYIIEYQHHTQQNGVSERKNRTVLDTDRSMLQFAQLSPQFWEEVVGTACYIQNRGFYMPLELNTPLKLANVKNVIKIIF